MNNFLQENLLFEKKERDSRNLIINFQEERSFSISTSFAYSGNLLPFLYNIWLVGIIRKSYETTYYAVRDADLFMQE